MTSGSFGNSRDNVITCWDDYDIYHGCVDGNCAHPTGACNPGPCFCDMPPNETAPAPRNDMPDPKKEPHFYLSSRQREGMTKKDFYQDGPLGFLPYTRQALEHGWGLEIKIVRDWEEEYYNWPLVAIRPQDAEDDKSWTYFHVFLDKRDPDTPPTFWLLDLTDLRREVMGLKTLLYPNNSKSFVQILGNMTQRVDNYKVASFDSLTDMLEELY